MIEIVQDLPLNVGQARAYAGVSQPELLDQWWTLNSRGHPEVGALYDLDFGPQYRWRARVTRAVPSVAFELEMTEVDADWRGTTIGFQLEPQGSGTLLHFHHRGWREASAHYRTTNHCWALYLRVLRRHLELGETVPYLDRLLC